MALRTQGPPGRSGGAGGLHASLLEWANGGPDHEAEGDQAQHVWAGEVRPAAPAITVRSMMCRLTKSWGEPSTGCATMRSTLPPPTSSGRCHCDYFVSDQKVHANEKVWPALLFPSTTYPKCSEMR